MAAPNAKERSALQNASGEWEYREKLGGAKTFQSLLDNRWIKPFSGHNPAGDKFTITQLGREALKLTAPALPRSRRLRSLQPQVRILKDDPER
jgi:hypothetical protein